MNKNRLKPRCRNLPADSHLARNLMTEAESQSQSRLSAELLSMIRCIACREPLKRQDDGYSCSACGRRFPEVRGVLRFVAADSYADSFSYQWQRYARTQLDHSGRSLSEHDFIKKTGFAPEELRGKLVLDVGCGMGRFAEVATRWGARVIGIDLSAAAEVAARN